MRTMLRTRELALALRDTSEEVQEFGEGSWTAIVYNGAAIPVKVTLDGVWVALQAPSGVPACGQDPWELLVLNGRIEGPSKFALDPGRFVPHLRAEVPLDDEVHLTSRLAAAFSGIRVGHAALLSPQSGGETPASRWDHVGQVGRSEDQRSVADRLRIDLTELCNDSGWPFTEREGGSLAVDLGVRAGFQQARVTREGSGETCASVSVARLGALPQVCRDALGVFLLTACRLVRLARATIDEQKGRSQVSFEVRLADPLSAGELGHALGALSAACRHFAAEVVSLQVPAVAERFLQLRGWPGRPASPLHQLRSAQVEDCVSRDSDQRSH
ncbi:MAG: hypothetical protein AB1486_00970 [Planctomycetota bacterium]